MDASPDRQSPYQAVKIATEKDILQDPSFAPRYIQWHRSFIERVDNEVNHLQKDGDTLHFIAATEQAQTKVVSVNQQGEYLHIFDHQTWDIGRDAQVTQTYTLSPNGQITRSIYTREQGKDYILVNSKSIDELKFDNTDFAEALLNHIYDMPYKDYAKLPLLRELRQRLEKARQPFKPVKIATSTPEFEDEDTGIKKVLKRIKLQTGFHRGIFLSLYDDGLEIYNYRDFLGLREKIVASLGNDGEIDNVEGQSILSQRQSLITLLDALEHFGINPSSHHETIALGETKSLLFETLCRYTPRGEDMGPLSEESSNS